MSHSYRDGCVKSGVALACKSGCRLTAYVDKSRLLKENTKVPSLITKRRPNIKVASGDKFRSELVLPGGKGRKAEGGLRTKGYFKHTYKFSKGSWYIRDLDERIHLPIEGCGYNGLLPLVSIITVVYNGVRYLEETIVSVINQSYPNVEYIVIDGGSSDGTLDVLEKYDDSIDYWVSEKDDGMYDALNKGLRLITGDIYASLNSDDRYFGHTVSTVVRAFVGEIDIVFGSPCFVYDERKCSSRKLFDLTYNDLLSFGACTLLPQPTTFIRASLAKKLGQFSPKYVVASDYDYLLRAMMLTPKAKYLNQPLTMFRRHDDSLTEKSAKTMLSETAKIVKEHKNFCRISLLDRLRLKAKYTIYNPVILLNLARRMGYRFIPARSRS